VRECFVARPGYVFAFADYSAIELAALAQCCIDYTRAGVLGFTGSSLAEAIAEGRDLHVDLATAFAGPGGTEISYEDLSALIAAGDKNAKDSRQFAKIGNYGLFGGMSPPTFVHYGKAQGAILSIETARKVHAALRERWREARPFFDLGKRLCDSPTGKCERFVFPRSGLIRGNVTYTAVLNGHFQHVVAMGAKLAVYRVARECYADAGSPLFGCRPWLFAHDEIGMEIPWDAIGPERATLAVERLCQVMYEAMKEWIPDVPVGVEPRVSRRWYKGVPGKRDANGWFYPVKPAGKDWVRDDDGRLAT
jgi:DNA polymerase I-like protein with 3'-5' exonuclease and polymerase domains